MAVTPFLKLQKPPFDTIPWDEAVNGNMDTIDAFISRYMAVPNYMGAWTNSTAYVSGQNVLDITNAIIYQCAITHTSSATPTTFAQDRTTYPTYWIATQNVITGGAGNTVLTIAEATPLTAKAGDLWWDSLGGQLYVMYNDGNSLQWVIANNQAGNVGEAPNDGSVYGRRMSAWTPISQGNVGRNLIHNSMFNIAQRGVGPFSVTSANVLYYGFDRWAGAVGVAGEAYAMSVIQHTDANRAAIGDEAAQQFISNGFTGSATAGGVCNLVQRIEGVRRLAGKTVTVSFWANALPAMPVAINLVQFFGTGGSPSASAGVSAQAVNITNIWSRYSLTLAIPSAAGKTFGTNAGTDWTSMTFVLSSASPIAGVGVQSGTINIWGVQLEITQPGQTQPTPLEKPDPELQLRQCQRFYFTDQTNLGQYGSAGGPIGTHISFPVTMRAMPTLAFVGTTYVNASSISSTGTNANGFGLSANATATGNTYITGGTFTASADL